MVVNYIFHFLVQMREEPEPFPYLTKLGIIFGPVTCPVIKLKTIPPFDLGLWKNTFPFLGCVSVPDIFWCIWCLGHYFLLGVMRVPIEEE